MWNCWLSRLGNQGPRSLFKLLSPESPLCPWLSALKATGTLKAFLWTTDMSFYCWGLSDTCTCWVSWDLNLELLKLNFSKARKTTHFGSESMKSLLPEPQKMVPDAAKLRKLNSYPWLTKTLRHPQNYQSPLGFPSVGHQNTSIFCWPWELLVLPCFIQMIR